MPIVSSFLYRNLRDDLKQTIVNKISAPLAYDVTESTLQAVLIACNFRDYCSLVTKKLDMVLESLCEQIIVCDNVEHVAKLLYILLVLLQSRIQFGRGTPLNCKTLVELALKYADSSNYLCSLRILDSLSSVSYENVEDIESVRTTSGCLNIPNDQFKLIDNLCSPFHKVSCFPI